MHALKLINYFLWHMKKTIKTNPFSQINFSNLMYSLMIYVLADDHLSEILDNLSKCQFST